VCVCVLCVCVCCVCVCVSPLVCVFPRLCVCFSILCTYYYYYYYVCSLRIVILFIFVSTCFLIYFLHLINHAPPYETHWSHCPSVSLTLFCLFFVSVLYILLWLLWTCNIITLWLLCEVCIYIMRVWWMCLLHFFNKNTYRQTDKHCSYFMLFFGVSSVSLSLFVLSLLFCFVLDRNTNLCSYYFRRYP